MDKLKNSENTELTMEEIKELNSWLRLVLAEKEERIKILEWELAGIKDRYGRLREKESRKYPAY